VKSCSTVRTNRLRGIPAIPGMAPVYRDPGRAILSDCLNLDIVKNRPVTFETSLVKRLQSKLESRSSRSQASAIAVGIGDDAAVWRPRAGFETILTTDWFLEGRHFLPDLQPAESVGWKCLARAVSDIAAMCGEPRCFLLSLALPTNRTGRWLDQFLAGLRSASRKLGCPVAGGDSTQHRDILINITVVGECRPRHVILRSGARAGDAIFVTGRLGEAEYGLRLLQTHSAPVALSDPRLRKQLYPEPRLAVGSWLRKHRLATSMMDLSDGLSSDLSRLCDASAVGARIQSALLPQLSTAKKDRRATFNVTEMALHGGDDYELLFTVDKTNVSRIPRTIDRIPITRIGTIAAGSKILVTDISGRVASLENRGWDPFR